MKRPLTMLTALLALVLARPAAAQWGAGAPNDVADWGKLAVVSQTATVTVTRAGAAYRGSFALKASAALPAVAFCFPVWADGTGKESAEARLDGTPVPPLPHLRSDKPGTPPTMPKYDPAKPDEYRRDAAARSRAYALRNQLQTLFGYPLTTFLYTDAIVWQAFELDFKAEQTREVEVAATLAPRRLAALAEHGPCEAYVIPIRLARLYAAPGKLSVTVTLDPAIEPADVVLVRPAEVKRDGAKFTLELADRAPVEDLVLVVKFTPAAVPPAAPGPK